MKMVTMSRLKLAQPSDTFVPLHNQSFNLPHISSYAVVVLAKTENACDQRCYSLGGVISGREPAGRCLDRE